MSAWFRVQGLRHAKFQVFMCLWNHFFDLRFDVMRGFTKLGVPFLGGPYNKDHSIWGSILGSPYLGRLPFTGGEI